MADKATARELGQIEARMTMARDVLSLAYMDLKRFGHDDSAVELDAILTQLRRLRTTTQDRMSSDIAARRQSGN
jgi:hypothetical protein